VLSNFRVFVVKKSFAIKYKKITTNPDSQKTVATLLRLPHGRPEGCKSRLLVNGNHPLLYQWRRFIVSGVMKRDT